MKFADLPVSHSIFRVVLSCFFILVCGMQLFAQTQLVYKDSTASIDARVKDLIARMTPEEKFRQLFMVAGDLGKDSSMFDSGLFGFQINTLPTAPQANQQIMTYAAGPSAALTLQKINNIQRFFVEDSRLGIPMIAFDEALHGLVCSDATAFPQAIGMAASFDIPLMEEVSKAISAEVKARGIRMVLSPVVNLATDVRWGRVEETYGEDPYLASQFGVAFVSAMEKNGIITTPKHFVTNHGDGGRDSYPVYWNERWMRETYFKPFKSVIQQGGARSLMTAYNSYDGRPCTQNNYLLNDVLRKEWGFKGFVISDAAAAGGANVLHFTARDYNDAGKQSIENGLDVIFQSDFSSYPLFKEPFITNQVDQVDLNTALTNVLRIKFELGLFDHPYTSETLLRDLDMKKHRQLAYEMAVKSMVLLKNENETLPIRGGIKRIAVVGEDAVEARLGGYSGPGNDVVSILEGIQNRAGEGVEVNYFPVIHRNTSFFVPIPAANLFHRVEGKLEPGLVGIYYNNPDLSGDPVLTRIDQQIAFQWTLFGPDASVNYDFFGVEWEGVIVTEESCMIRIGVDGNDGYWLYINDELIIDRSNQQSYHLTEKPYYFTKGLEYNIRIEYGERSGNARFNLVWDGYSKPGIEVELNNAISEVCRHELIIVVVGIEEGEFRDRSNLALPGNQVEFIQKLWHYNQNVVVVIVGGSAVTMDPWIDNVRSVIDVWYPGEAGGDAVAAVLFGDENPAGRLPITFPKSVGQVPLNYNHPPTGRGDDYLDGTGQALFPFGYGLSYTEFAYSNLAVDRTSFKKNEDVEIGFTVTNKGERAGDEVVQLYLRDELASVVRPLKELKRFARITLLPGESKEVVFKLKSEDFVMFNEAMQEVIEPGDFRIMIGGSSKDIRLRTIITCIE